MHKDFTFHPKKYDFTHTPRSLVLVQALVFSPWEHKYEIQSLMQDGVLNTPSGPK